MPVDLILYVPFHLMTIDCADVTGSSKINNENIEKVEETENYIYLKLSSGGHLIIPKLKIADITSTKAYLHTFAEQLNIPYSEELDWKWK